MSIFQLCIDGVGFKGIADELNRRGVTSPGGGQWPFSAVKSILANPGYRGDIVWNRRSDSKFYEVRNGRADCIKPSKQAGQLKLMHEGDWIVIADAAPPIVERVALSIPSIAEGLRELAAPLAQRPSHPQMSTNEIRDELWRLLTEPDYIHPHLRNPPEPSPWRATAPRPTTATAASSNT